MKHYAVLFVVRAGDVLYLQLIKEQPVYGCSISSFGGREHYVLLGLSQHSIRMDWELMELCKSVGRKREVGIKGDCWDESAGCMGLCSDKCKLKEVVCPFGKCGDEVYRGCEKGDVMSCEKETDEGLNR